MDIFKPVGDENCERPMMVLVHGGAWVGGSKEDSNIKFIAREMAKRGWVVASINYRLGTHKASNYNMYAFCNTDISQPCGYIADSAEVYRANFRGMQDAKGAIRFMKKRHLQDSTDINQVFITGESAGAFIALAVAFTDSESKKHPTTLAIADALVPSANLNAYGCNPTPNNRSRPDLGSVEGTLHLGEYDASVKGAGSFYGGIMDLSIISSGENAPAVYLYHQGSDVVVHYNYGRLLGRISNECFAPLNLCQPYFHYPHAYGGEGIRRHFESMGSQAPSFQAEIVSNYSFQNNCFSNGHEISGRAQRVQNMAEFFAGKITSSGGNCQVLNAEPSFDLRIYPNPSSEHLTVEWSGNTIEKTYRIFNQLGEEVQQGRIHESKSQIGIGSLPPGIYMIKVDSRIIRWVKY